MIRFPAQQKRQRVYWLHRTGEGRILRHTVSSPCSAVYTRTGGPSASLPPPPLSSSPPFSFLHPFLPPPYPPPVLSLLPLTLLFLRTSANGPARPPPGVRERKVLRRSNTDPFSPLPPPPPPSIICRPTAKTPPPPPPLPFSSLSFSLFPSFFLPSPTTSLYK